MLGRRQLLGAWGDRIVTPMVQMKKQASGHTVACSDFLRKPGWEPQPSSSTRKLWLAREVLKRALDRAPYR